MADLAVFDVAVIAIVGMLAALIVIVWLLATTTPAPTRTVRVRVQHERPAVAPVTRVAIDPAPIRVDVQIEQAPAPYRLVSSQPVRKAVRGPARRALPRRPQR